MDIKNEVLPNVISISNDKELQKLVLELIHMLQCINMDDVFDFSNIVDHRKEKVFSGGISEKYRDLLPPLSLALIVTDYNYNWFECKVSYTEDTGRYEVVVNYND